jgi:hypothetical protein
LILVHPFVFQESDCCTVSATWNTCKATCLFFYFIFYLFIFLISVFFPNWHLVLPMTILFGCGLLRSNSIIHSILLIWIFYLWQIYGKLFLHADCLVAYSKLILSKLLR